MTLMTTRRVAGTFALLTLFCALPVAKTGQNVIAVRVDHSSITELFLGGIIRPVLLIKKPADSSSP